jgi:hypothetical protein
VCALLPPSPTRHERRARARVHQVPEAHRVECTRSVLGLKGKPAYAEYIQPALDMCGRNLKDDIPLVVEQLGEALCFCAMAISMRTFGPDMQVFRREVQVGDFPHRALSRVCGNSPTTARSRRSLCAAASRIAWRRRSVISRSRQWRHCWRL